MLLNIIYCQIHNSAAKLRKYFDMCKFFCTFAAFFRRIITFMSKLLIIDDERGIRNTLREILSDEGHDVDVAENGKQGLEMACAKSYDLIFSDIKMPEMDGLELLKALKEGEEAIETPIVMISGHGDVETADSGTLPETGTAPLVFAGDEKDPALRLPAWIRCWLEI